MSTSGKQRWRDLSPRRRAIIVGAGLVQVTLAVAALRDLSRRPAAQVRGPKGAWVAASFVNGIGPIAYFACGRRRPRA